MFRYACSLGLAAEYRQYAANPLVRDIVRMAIALPLLPAAMIEEGFNVCGHFFILLNCMFFNYIFDFKYSAHLRGEDI